MGRRLTNGLIFLAMIAALVLVGYVLGGGEGW
jgi:hypothetical protein